MITIEQANEIDRAVIEIDQLARIFAEEVEHQSRVLFDHHAKFQLAVRSVLERLVADS